MTIIAYVDKFNQIHIDPTVVINSNNVGVYKVKFIFQENWSSDLTLYGVFKPVNDIPISFKCNESNEVELPELNYGYYKKLGIGLKGTGVSKTTTSAATTVAKSFDKSDFILQPSGEYECVISRSDLDITGAILLSINVISDIQTSVLEPIDYFVRYTPTQIIITLNADLSTYSEYRGNFNFIAMGEDNVSTTTKQITLATDYYYVPIQQGVR